MAAALGAVAPDGGRADPAAELRRLHDELRRSLLPAVHQLPTRDDPLGEMVCRLRR
ncbi:MULTISPECIES: hypothetical protein [unclassified Modestobacter]